MKKNCFGSPRGGIFNLSEKRTIWEKEKSGIRGGCRGRCRRRRRGYECAGCGRSENAVCGRKTLGESAPAAVRLTNRRHKLSRKHLNRSQQTRVARLRLGCLMSNHSQLTRTKRLLRRLTRKPPIRTLRPNILPAAFLKSFPVSFRRSQTDCAGMQQKTDQLKQQTAYYKRIWDQPQTRQAIRVGFYELGEIIRHVLPRKLEVLESSGQAIRLLPDRSWRYRECCIPGIKEISGWNRILKRNISKENFTSKA